MASTGTFNNPQHRQSRSNALVQPQYPNKNSIYTVMQSAAASSSQILSGNQATAPSFAQQNQLAITQHPQNIRTANNLPRQQTAWPRNRQSMLSHQSPPTALYMRPEQVLLESNQNDADYLLDNTYPSMVNTTEHSLHNAHAAQWHTQKPDAYIQQKNDLLQKQHINQLLDPRQHQQRVSDL